MKYIISSLLLTTILLSGFSQSKIVISNQPIDLTNFDKIESITALSDQMNIYAVAELSEEDAEFATPGYKLFIGSYVKEGSVTNETKIKTLNGRYFLIMDIISTPETTTAPGTVEWAELLVKAPQKPKSGEIRAIRGGDVLAKIKIKFAYSGGDLVENAEKCEEAYNKIASTELDAAEEEDSKNRELPLRWKENTPLKNAELNNSALIKMFEASQICDGCTVTTLVVEKSSPNDDWVNRKQNGVIVSRETRNILVTYKGKEGNCYYSGFVISNKHLGNGIFEKKNSIYQPSKIGHVYKINCDNIEK